MTIHKDVTCIRFCNVGTKTTAQYFLVSVHRLAVYLLSQEPLGKTNPYEYIKKRNEDHLLGDNKTNIKFPNCAVLTIPRILPFISSDDFNLEYELALTFPKPWKISNRFRTHKYNLAAENKTKATPSIRYTLSTLITLRKMQPNLALSFPHPDQTYSMNEFELSTKGTVILLLFNVTMDCLAGLYRWNAILICDKL